MAINIQLRRGTSAQWSSANPILALAEIGVEIDTDQFKIGNGVDNWNTLPYGGLQGPKGVPGYFLGFDLIGASTNIADRPASANNGDAWGLIVGETLEIYIWNVDTWYSAGPITSPPHYPIANTLYVAVDGDNNNSGTSPATAVQTIERALQLAAARQDLTLIEVGPGDYYTQGHLDLPDDTIMKCAHRSAIIRPAAGYEERNVFRMGSGCFIEGFVFEGWRVNDMDNPTEGFAVSFRPGAIIKRTPYAHKIAVRSIPYWDTIAPPLDRENGNPLVGRGGGVILADGKVCSQYSVFPNIMTWGATPVTPNGIGYVAKNGALINAVNAVAMWAHKHFMALNGGQLILSSCSTQFGDYTMVAKGYRNLVNPTLSTQTLVVTTASEAIVASNTSTIINNMWDALVAGNYTTGWNADDETLTKRDANTFLRSLRWVLQSANEKPMLDFAKGLFDTLGDPVFSSDKLNAFVYSFENMRDQVNSLIDAAPAGYNEAKCSRDIGLIVNAIGMDTLYDSTSDSQFAGLQYWSQTGLNAVPNAEITATIASISYLNDIAQTYVDSSTTGTLQTLFSTITNILNNGTVGITDQVNYGSFPSTATSITTSYDALQSNKNAMQHAVIDWIGTTYPSLVYNTSTCFRDVGYIIDSVSFDLLHGGNIQSIKSGVYYYGYSSTTTNIPNEVSLTVKAYNYLKNIIPDIVSGNSLTKVYQTGTIQVTAGTTATSVEAALIQSKIDYINDIIVDGPSQAGPLIPLTGTIESVDIQNAYSMLIANEDFLKAEIVAFINYYPQELVIALIAALNQTLTNTQYQREPSLITAIGHTWTAVMAGVALTKIPPARNQARIQDSILELDEGNVIASGQDDQGNAIFVGGLEINADTGELTGPPFTSAVNQIATKVAITRSF